MVFPDNYVDLALPQIWVKSCADLAGRDISSPKDLKLLDETKYNPIILLGDCNVGKSALCKWLRNDMEAGNRKVYVIDLPRAARLWKAEGKHPESVFELVDGYFGKGTVSFDEKSELLLDEHHQLSSDDQKRLRSIISEVELAGEKLPVRVWVFARKNFENRICTGGERQAVFELAGYSISDQQRIILNKLEDKFGRTNDEHENAYRKDYMRCLYAELQKSFPDFGKTFGKSPVMLDGIAVCVKPHFEGFIKGYHTNKEDTVGVNREITNKIMQNLSLVTRGNMVTHIISALVKTHVQKKRGLKEEDVEHATNLGLIVISDFALDTFPSYQEGELDIALRKRDMICDSGFVSCDDEGKLKFHSMILADALIGRYFADTRIIRHTAKNDEFFTNVLLLKKEAAVARHFFNMALPSQRSKTTEFYNKNLRNFLTKRYKLDDRDEWLKIRNEGNIWQMYVLERNYEIASLLYNCFDPRQHKQEIARFFKMRVLLTITCLFDDSLMGNKPFKVLVSNISLAAMFLISSRDTEIMLKLMLAFYTVDEIKAEFTAENVWTPIHFAAMNANSEFLRTMYNMKTNIPTIANLRNPFNQTAVHLVGYSLAWRYELELGKNIGAQRSHWAEVLAGRDITKYMYDCLELLVDKGGEDIDACEGITGDTVHQMADKAKNEDTASFILKLKEKQGICDAK